MSRLPTDLVVSALLRRTNDSGGFGAVLARGDAQAGGVLLVLASRDGPDRVLERGLGPDGSTALIESRTGDDLTDYWRKRRRNDPDLWVVELDSPLAERFAAETLLAN
jgi:hypothetical protein